MKIFRKLAALAAAVVTAVAALQVTAGAAKAPAWTYEAQELDSGKETTCYLSKDGSWVDFQITAERTALRSSTRRYTQARARCWSRTPAEAPSPLIPRR